ncbi:alpha/beta hydrolase [Arthrobacter sp. NPDC058288]|uniref:alpha/beta hydrolase n=1 Tax=Arthrobacter sp. NPDC058288 TaxID=3346424 RepID=UPI0036F0D263
MKAAEPGALSWQPDLLGEGFESLELPLADDDEGTVCATLVRYVPPVPAGPPAIFSALRNTVFRPLEWPGTDGREPNGSARPGVVLYLHGWADYFLQAELARHVGAHGLHFYALDLRKYGRSLRNWQTPGYTTDLSVYDEDISAAIDVIRTDVAARTGLAAESTVHMLAHSLGGLIGALWADRHPGSLGTLILNAPWLELQGSSLIRNIAMHLVEPIARTDPRRPFRFPEMPGYWESVSDQAHGEWFLDPQWRPTASFPIRAGWTRAVLAGHAAVERRLDIAAPVLVMLSDRTRIQAEWSEELMVADAVIDVEQTARRALGLGRRTAVFRYPQAIHDVFLSRREVRQEAYRDLVDWLHSHPG